MGLCASGSHLSLLGWEPCFFRGSAGPGVDQGSQEDVPELVETDAVEVGVGEVELESAAKILDPLLEVFPAQSGNRRCELFELSLRAHGLAPAKHVVIIRNIQAARGLSPSRRGGF